MKNTKSKSRGWLVTLIAASVLVLYVACFFVPGQKAIASLRRQTTEKQQTVVTANVQQQSLPHVEFQLERTNRFVDAWRQASPHDRHIVELLGKIASLAKDADVQVNRLTPQEPVTMATLTQHSLLLKVEGDYAKLIDFLAQLEGLSETIWVRQLGMKPSSENGTFVQCDLILTVFADNHEVSG